MRHLADDITDQVIDRFIDQRKKLGLSHEKLAEKAGLHRSAISLIESKKRSPSLKNCLCIAMALELELAKIIKETSD